MLSMTEQNYLRDLYFNGGCSVAEIMRITGFDKKTIRKYIMKKADSSSVPHEKKIRNIKIDKYKELIDSWMDDDIKSKRKQRHTATRIFQRLSETFGEDFDCSYRTVADYVSQRKKDIFKNYRSYIPLKHIPGEAQVDFGKAEFFEKGVKYEGSYLVVSFPFSNGAYLQVFKGENTECLLEGLISIFKHMGGVPKKLWFDNMSTVVAKILKNGERVLTDSFTHFQQFYGFSSTFCNPNSGNEKGNVENKVGYLRRNLLVPVPEFSDINAYNKELIDKCDKDMERVHYAKENRIKELFSQDKKVLLNLPEQEYEAARYEKLKTDGYGKFTLNGKHTYSTAPRLAGEYVTIKITANTVIPLDKDFNEITVHKRLYGSEKQESMDWLPYLTQLSKRPRAVKYTEFYEMFPDDLKPALENIEDRKEILKAMAEMSVKSSFEMCLIVLEQAVLCNKFDQDSLKAIYQRLSNSIEDLPPLVLNNTPSIPANKIDLNVYDTEFLGGKGC